MISQQRWLASGVASLFWMVLILAGTGCDAIQSVNTDKPPEVAVPAPVTPAPVTPPPMTPEPPAPVVKTPQQIIKEFLALSTVERRDAHLTQLAGLPEGLDAITTLDLSRSGVSDDGMKTLTAFPQLTELNIAETRISNIGLASVAEAKSLRTLTLVNLVGVDDSGIKHLATLKDLESVTISACPVSDAAFTTLAELEGLQVINVSACPNVYGRGFVLLTSKNAFRNLRELHVSGSKFGNYGLDQLNKLPKLEVLRASRCELVGPTIAGLAGCDELKVLDLSGNALFDDNMKVVSRLKNLEELRLGQIPNLTDECLNSLKILKHLKVLDLEGNKITEPAVKRLKEKFLKDTEILALGQKF